MARTTAKDRIQTAKAKAKAKATTKTTKTTKATKATKATTSPRASRTREASSRKSAHAPPATRPATASLADTLDAARAAVVAGAWARALSLLLAAWRAYPATPIAEAIGAVGARAAAGVMPPSGVTAKERNAAWDRAAREGDPVMLGVLAATLTDTKGSAETLARIELLIGHRDPRIAARITDLVETPAYNASVGRTRAFWKRIFALLPELGDPRIAQRQHGFDAAWAANAELNAPERPELAKRLAAVAPAITQAYGDGPPELTADDLARCTAVRAALATTAEPTGARTEAELLAEIYAAPADDQARLVYADALSERGDPRGEFIVLQLARARGEPVTKAQRAREAELLAEHGTRWIGPLARQVTKQSLVFERGFLASCAFNQQMDYPERSHRFEFGIGIDESPEWATVREVAGGVPATDACRVGALRVLRDVTNDHVAHLTTLTRPLAVEELAWEGPYVRYQEDPGEAWRHWTATFARIRVLPALRRLAIAPESGTGAPPAEVRFLRMAPCTNLEALRVTTRPVYASAWLALIAPTPIGRLEIHQRFDDWCLRFERAPDGAFAHLTIVVPRRKTVREVFGREVIEGLDALPPTQVTTVHVQVAASTRALFEDLRPSLEASLRRQTRLVAPIRYEAAPR